MSYLPKIHYLLLNKRGYFLPFILVLLCLKLPGNIFALVSNDDTATTVSACIDNCSDNDNYIAVKHHTMALPGFAIEHSSAALRLIVAIARIAQQTRGPPE